MLAEYAKRSKGKIKLEVYDPEPDSEQEEWATKYGIHRAALPDGSSLFFGLVATASDREEVIPMLDQRRQELLEYDVSQLVYKVGRTKIPKIGLLSSTLEVMGPGGRTNPAQGAAMGQEWVFLTEIRKNFEVEKLDSNIQEIPDNITLLVVVHPKNYSEQLTYALDQYVLRGGRLVLLLDPNSREEASRDMGAQFGQGGNYSSNLPKLLQAWGVEYDPSQIVGDLESATSVNTGTGIQRYPLWMSFTDAYLSKGHPIANQLESLLFIEAGTLKHKEGDSSEFTPVLSTSSKSGLMNSQMARFASPENISQQLKLDGSPKVIAAVVRGSFSSAFPAGQPAAAPDEDPEHKSPSNPPSHPHLLQAKDPGTIFIVADSDFLADNFTVQKFNFMGQSMAKPSNDNINFMMNAVEFLSGNDALMSIRNRGRFVRPFDRVIALQQKAQAQFQQEEQVLQTKLKEVQQQLSDLQRRKGGDDASILSSEQQSEIRRFREEEIGMRKRLREVRKILRQDIESLGNWLFLLNAFLIPMILAGAGFWSYRRRSMLSGKQSS